jgi:polysaccharide export outer membrane protein
MKTQDVAARHEHVSRAGNTERELVGGALVIETAAARGRELAPTLSAHGTIASGLHGDRTMSTTTNARGLSGRLAWLAFASLTAGACFGSGGREPMAVIPPGAEASNTASMADANQRLFAAAASDADVSTTTSVDEYQLGAQDRINVIVFGAETFSGEFAVDESGAIAVPLLGPVPAANRTPRQLEEDLEARLRETYMRDPHVTVSVLEMRSHGISVLGAVNAPGVHQVPGKATLLDVLAQAEGLSDAAGNRITVTRGGSSGENVEVNLSNLLYAGTPDANIEVRAGDVVHVHNASLVYVVGEVNNPGGFTMPLGEQMTVLQALSMAQGTNNVAADWNSVIVRTRPDGSQVEVPVDVGKVLDGELAPPPMQPSDVLYIPRNGAKAAAIGVANAFVRVFTFRGLFE